MSSTPESPSVPTPGDAPKPAAPPAAPAPAKAAAPAAKPAPAGMTRRTFGWLGGAWAAFAATVGIGSLASVRFLFPSVLFEPPTSFKAGYPADFSEGVSELFKDRFGVWIVKTSEGFYALRTVCTHLGCTPNWLSTEGKFKCPCHGSGFYMTGINFEGPAPRPLERVAISLASDGQILVDKSRIFQQELGQWEDPACFLKA